MNAGRTLVVVDPGMDHPGGHHLLTNVELARASEELGLACRFYADRACDPAAFRALGCNVVPTFSIGPYLSSVPGRDELLSHLAAKDCLVAEYAAVVVPDGALVLMHTACPWHLRALASRLESVVGARVAVGLILPFAFWTADGQLAALLEAMTDRAVSELGRFRCVVYSETGAGKGSVLLLHPFSEGTMTEIDARLAAADGPEESKIRMGYFGMPRRSKGFDLLTGLLASRALDDRADLEFEFFLPPGYQDFADDLNRLSPRVRASSTFRDNRRYLADMLSVDVVLCVYDPDSYRQQMSGIVTEAALLGRAALVTADTAPLRFMDTYAPGASQAVDFTPQAVLNGLTQPMAVWRERQARAVASRLATRRLKSAPHFFNTAFGPDVVGPCPHA